MAESGHCRVDSFTFSVSSAPPCLAAAAAAAVADADADAPVPALPSSSILDSAAGRLDALRNQFTLPSFKSYLLGNPKRKR